MTSDEWKNNPTIKSLFEYLNNEIEILGDLPAYKSSYEYLLLKEIRAGFELWGADSLDSNDLDALAKLSPKEIIDTTCKQYIFEYGADKWLCSDFSSRDLLKEWLGYILGESCTQ